MSTVLGWAVAIASTAAFIWLWFRDVRRIMGQQKSTLESAAGQLAASRKRADSARGDAEAAAVLARSQKIYRQAQSLYRQTLHKPWVFLPALLMGYSHPPVLCDPAAGQSDVCENTPL